MNDDPTELARRVLEYCEKATPGPWTWDGVDRVIFRDVAGEDVKTDADLIFCARARTDLPALARAVLAQAERKAEAIDALEDCEWLLSEQEYHLPRDTEQRIQRLRALLAEGRDEGNGES